MSLHTRHRKFLSILGIEKVQIPFQILLTSLLEELLAKETRQNLLLHIIRTFDRENPVFGAPPNKHVILIGAANSDCLDHLDL